MLCACCEATLGREGCLSCSDSSFCPSKPNTISVFLGLMAAKAQAKANARRGERREERDEQIRNVRARLDDHDQQIEHLDILSRQHDLRLQYLESSYKIILRGWDCTGVFLREKDANFKAAKGEFVHTFLTELRDNSSAIVEGQITEAENLLAEEEGAVLIGLFPTGGWAGDKADVQLRLQQTYNGLRLGALFRIIGQSVTLPRVLHQDRPRLRGVNKGKGKGGGGKAKGKGKNKGGKGRGGEPPAPKAAGIPLVPGLNA